MARYTRQATSTETPPASAPSASMAADGLIGAATCGGVAAMPAGRLTGARRSAGASACGLVAVAGCTGCLAGESADEPSRDELSGVEEYRAVMPAKGAKPIPRARSVVPVSQSTISCDCRAGASRFSNSCLTLTSPDTRRMQRSASQIARFRPFPPAGRAILP